MPIASITLDNEWLRRVRAKISNAEITRAEELADEDVRQWLRRLYGDVARDEYFEVIVDDNGDSINVADEMIAEYEANSADDRFKAVLEVANALASLYVMEWCDFLNGGSDESMQYKAVDRLVRFRKRQCESIGYLKKIDDTVRRFQRLAEHKGMHTKKKSRT